MYLRTRTRKFLSLFLFFSILSLVFHISFISLPSSPSISPPSFPSFSLISLHPFPMYSIVFHLLMDGTFCTFFPLLPSNVDFLSPRSHFRISLSFFFLLYSLSPGTPESPLLYTSHAPCRIWIL
jgi:hypothetical protein